MKEVFLKFPFEGKGGWTTFNELPSTESFTQLSPTFLMYCLPLKDTRGIDITNDASPQQEGFLFKQQRQLNS